MSHLSVDYRPDIDGIRAIAILAVIGGHAASEFLPGGFVGVDIFFVISGFLITRIILNEMAEKRFSFFKFFGRRVRRLFPALIVVLLAVWAYGWFFLLPAEFVDLGW
jgi:peptidoglycan/LPS O-acetylase OafA/YrhL